MCINYDAKDSVEIIPLRAFSSFLSKSEIVCLYIGMSAKVNSSLKDLFKTSIVASPY